MLRAGTPAYMAPEQLAGGEVTPRSDIYALGLVLYELFTGRRALDAATMAELIAKREQADITLPTDVVRDLDAGIERVIMRCLEPDPARRPASALAVSAALPGGDPLAAALAAGETPSPDMVAASGIDGGRGDVDGRSRRRRSSSWHALAVLFLYQRRTDDQRRPAAEAAGGARGSRAGDRAEARRRRRGSIVGVRLRHLARLGALHRTDDDGAGPVEQAAVDAPRDLRVLVPHEPGAPAPYGKENPVEAVNPPMIVSGMTLVTVDAAGRLAGFLRVPSAAQPPGAAREDRVGAALRRRGTADEHVQSGRRRTGVRRSTPTSARRGKDRCRKCRGASCGSKPPRPTAVPVFFSTTGPWTVSSRDPGTRREPSAFERAISFISSLVMPGLMLVSAMLARRNVKLGRGDRRGAFRAAAAVFFLILLAWLLGDRHVGSVDAELERFFTRSASRSSTPACCGSSYLGLEPYVRRVSPDSLIGWTRLVAGGWRDPRVGRDIMIGSATGLLMTVVFALHNLVPPLFGQAEPMPVITSPASVMSVRFALAAIVNNLQNALTSGMLGIGGFVAFRILTRRRWAAALMATVVFAARGDQRPVLPGPSLDRPRARRRDHDHVRDRDRVGRTAGHHRSAHDALHPAESAADHGLLHLVGFDWPALSRVCPRARPGWLLSGGAPRVWRSAPLRLIRHRPIRQKIPDPTRPDTSSSR